MSNESKLNEVPKEDRKKRKEERRKRREAFQNRLAVVSEDNPSERNPIIIEIVKEHLHKDIDVFQARWQTGAPLSNTVFLNTPLFWYKKHKWSHKDVKEFFKITGVYKENLDSECAVIWGIDENFRKKKEKRKQLKETLIKPRYDIAAWNLMRQEGSVQFVQNNDPHAYADSESTNIWNLLVENRNGADELNHIQFHIELVNNNIEVDPDLSVDLFYELIRTWEIIEKHREDKKNNPQKYAMTKKDKYKQSRGSRWFKCIWYDTTNIRSRKSIITNERYYGTC
eukprot:9181_1